MIDKTGGVVIEEFAGQRPNIYSFLADNSEYKKSKSENRNVVAIISHNEYKDVLNNKCIRHSMNRTQTKYHRKGTHEIKHIALFCFGDKLHIKTMDMTDQL